MVREEFAPFQPKVCYNSLRFAKVVDDKADRLWAEVLGVRAVGAGGEGIGQGRTVADPCVQAVERHVRGTIRKIHKGKF